MFFDLKNFLKAIMTDCSDPPPVAPIAPECGQDDHSDLNDTSVSTSPAGHPAQTTLLEPYTDSGRTTRKVRIKKVLGQKTPNQLPATLCGVEVGPPEVGARYCVQLEDNKIFCSSFVTGVYIQTENSLYQVEFMA